MSTQNNNSTTVQEKQNTVTAPAEIDRNISDSVMNRIKVFEETGTLHVPKNYSAPNALRVAWLMLADVKNRDSVPATQCCTKESIANAFLRMVIMGLNPAKRQCSFVVYGNQLSLQREYNGAIAMAKRDAGVTKVVGRAILKGDEFESEIDMETQRVRILKHKQTMESLEKNEVVGAYAVKFYNDGTTNAEIMPMSQIRNAWNMGAAKGQSPAHKNFPDQMAIKTVINRALKIDLNSSDDAGIMEEVENDESMTINDPHAADVKHQIAEKANKKEMEMDVDVQEDYGDDPDPDVDTATGEVLQTTTQRPY